jgi:hypothetical protein
MAALISSTGTSNATAIVRAPNQQDVVVVRAGSTPYNSVIQSAEISRPSSFTVNHQTIVVLDFGSQFTQLIARRLRELSVFAEILPFDTPLAQIAERPNPARRTAIWRSTRLVCRCSGSVTGCS